jgi:hypothetical protein
MSTGETVMKTYAIHLYCQQVGICSGTHALQDEMQEHSIGINLFDVGVRKYIAICSRQEYLGRGSIFNLDGENHGGAETCSQSFGPEIAIFTVTSSSKRETFVSHVTPSNFWVRSIMALKERQVIDRMYVINNVSGERHVPTENN